MKKAHNQDRSYLTVFCINCDKRVKFLDVPKNNIVTCNKCGFRMSVDNYGSVHL